MKQVKLYNVIFPIWFIMFFPPVVIITLAGNYIIDSLVILLCFYVFKLKASNIEMKSFYLNNILKVWLFGFAADFVGAGILFSSSIISDTFEVFKRLDSAIFFDPFKSPVAVLYIIFAMLVSAALIFLFNNKITFRKSIEDKKLKLKVALTIAIITIPWTFLIPTKWFYHGF